MAEKMRRISLCGKQRGPPKIWQPNRKCSVWGTNNFFPSSKNTTSSECGINKLLAVQLIRTHIVTDHIENAHLRPKWRQKGLQHESASHRKSWKKFVNCLCHSETMQCKPDRKEHIKHARTHHERQKKSVVYQRRRCKCVYCLCWTVGVSLLSKHHIAVRVFVHFYSICNGVSGEMNVIKYKWTSGIVHKKSGNQMTRE